MASFGAMGPSSVRIRLDGDPGWVILRNDPFDAEHSEGLLHQGTLEAFEPNNGLVLTYELANLELIKTVTDKQGGFFFNQLPAGLYKVIAFKKGFVPAVMMLRRSTTDSRQFVDVVFLEIVFK